MKQAFEHPGRTGRKPELKVQTARPQSPESRHISPFPMSRTQRTLQLIVKSAFSETYYNVSIDSDGLMA